MLAIVWLAAAILLVVLFPREQPILAQPVAEATIAEPVLETLSPEQAAEWDAWLETRTPLADLLPGGETKVLLLKFNDYQCPACRQTWALYRGIIAKYEKAYPGVFVYETRDLPLEPECGLQLNHTMACEAAAAVRMARAKGRHREMETWLFMNQSPEMTRDQIKTALHEIAGVSDFEEQYPKMLDPIRADVQQAVRLGVTGTPTFYINGIKIDSLRPAYLDATIRHALKKAGVTAP
jgi:protein-disulfide isomerase